MSIEVGISERLSLNSERTKDELLGYLVVILQKMNYESKFFHLDLDHVSSFLGNSPIQFHKISNLGIKLVDMLREYDLTHCFSIERVLDHSVGVQCGNDCPHRREIVRVGFPDGGMN